jgi:hypothetical protein
VNLCSGGGDLLSGVRQGGEALAFEFWGLRLEEECLSFYVKPADGLQLPVIMQWLKQTFAVRFNRRVERTGRAWGDRYWSRVLEGELPKEGEELDWEAVDVGAETGEISFEGRPSDGVNPLTAENSAKPGFSPQNPARSPPLPD